MQNLKWAPTQYIRIHIPEMMMLDIHTCIKVYIKELNYLDKHFCTTNTL